MTLHYNRFPYDPLLYLLGCRVVCGRCCGDECLRVDYCEMETVKHELELAKLFKQCMEHAWRKSRTVDLYEFFEYQ